MIEGKNCGIRIVDCGFGGIPSIRDDDIPLGVGAWIRIWNFESGILNLEF